MGTSARQRIIDAITDRLSAVAALGGRVSAWRIEPVLPAECPCVVVFDTTGAGSFDESSLSEQSHSLTISIVLFTLPTSQAVQNRSIMADIMQAIGTDPRFGEANVTTTEFKALTLTRDKFNEVASGGHLMIEVNYVTNLWQI